MKRRAQSKSDVRVVESDSAFRHPSRITFESDQHEYIFIRKEQWGKREMFIYRCITEKSPYSDGVSSKFGAELPIEKEELEKYMNGKSFIKAKLIY